MEQQSIKAAFDSVKVIEDLNLLEVLDVEQETFKKANKDHLDIMMGKDWFSESLTQEQTDKINSVR